MPRTKTGAHIELAPILDDLFGLTNDRPTRSSRSGRGRRTGASDESPTESLCTPRAKYCQLGSKQEATLPPHTAAEAEGKKEKKERNDACPIRSPANGLSEKSVRGVSVRVRMLAARGQSQGRPSSFSFFTPSAFVSFLSLCLHLHLPFYPPSIPFPS